MKILFLGDIVGQSGCDFVARHILQLKQFYSADLIIANGENSAEGNGVLPSSADMLFACGIDVITLGNHALHRREIYSYLDENEYIIRPANYHPDAPGRGFTVYDRPGLPKIAIINLQGNTYLDTYKNAFDCADEILSKIDAPVKIVDFHAEATSEKLSLGIYLDGRISALVGTHTHVQTSDERIFPNGTGYITDAGMCGSFNSAIGVKPEQAIHRFRTGLPTRFEVKKEGIRLTGVLITVDGKTGMTTAISRISAE